jgi:hypothetical protein
MSALARYVVDAVVLERRSPTKLARDHGITRRWIHKLVKRFKEGGYAALEPRSRRPKSCRHQVETQVQELIVKLRGELTAAGHEDCCQTTTPPRRRLVLVGAMAVVVALFLPWLEATAPFVGTISRSLVALTTSDSPLVLGLAACGGLLGLLLTYRGPSIALGITVSVVALPHSGS